MAGRAAALLAAALLAAAAIGLAHGLEVYGLNGELMNNCTTSFTVAGKNFDFQLRGKVGTYKHGLASETGYYHVSGPGQYFGQNNSFWFQMCEEMEIQKGGSGPDCGEDYSCPSTCKKDGVCGAGCAAFLSLDSDYFHTCYNLGEWTVHGKNTASVTLLDPTDPSAGISYTVTHGQIDSMCPQGRTFTANVRCPAAGRSGAATPPTLPAGTGTECAFSTTMEHPAACPTSGETLGVGIFVLRFAGDDRWVGSTKMRFFIYTRPATASPSLSTRGGVPLCEPAAPGGAGKGAFAAPEMWYSNTEEAPKRGECPAAARMAVEDGSSCTHVQGTFSYPLHMWDFPFLDQVFKVVMERDGSDTPAPGGNVPPFCVLGDYTGLSEHYDMVPYDTFPELSWSQTTRVYPPVAPGGAGGNEAPRLVLSIHTRTPRVKAFKKYMLVPYAMLGIQVSFFFMHPLDDAPMRFSAGTVSLLSAISFHLGNTAILRTSKMSHLDCLMSIVYVLTCCNIVFNCWLILKKRTPACKPGMPLHKHLRQIARGLNITYGLFVCLALVIGIFGGVLGKPPENGRATSAAMAITFFSLVLVVSLTEVYLQRHLAKLTSLHAWVRQKKLKADSKVDEEAGQTMGEYGQPQTELPAVEVREVNPMVHAPE